MGDTSAQSIQSFKNTLFMWEVIIAAVVFIAAYFILKGFKQKEKAMRERNKTYNTTPGGNDN